MLFCTFRRLEEDNLKKIKLGCPNPECSNHKKNAKLKHNLTNCPICGSSLVHVCKNKKCHTLVEDDDKLYCVLCNADREDKKAVAAKGAAVGGAGLIGAGIKYRHAIKDVIVTLIRR